MTDSTSRLTAKADIGPCSCGHTHTVPIRHIFTGAGALNGLKEILKPFQTQNVYLMGDSITMALGRDRVLPFLEEAGCRVREHTFACEPGRHPVTDERLIGSALAHMAQETDLIVAIGSGTMNDTARVVAARCRIPYVIVATAPSMDGYASVTSAVVMDGGKKSLVLGTPYAVVGDTEFLKTAPDSMLAAGAGDILGKYIAIRDWRLANRETGEYFCGEIAGLVLATADRCADALPRLFSRDERMLAEMMDSLITAGIAISMYGTSRPAAGMEHQIAHAWEVEALRDGTSTGLHGHYVGLGTLAACRLYELASRDYDLPGAETMPAFETMSGYLGQLRGFCGLEALRVRQDAFRGGILHAAQPEIRYTLASFLRQQGKIEAYADKVTEEFFG